MTSTREDSQPAFMFYVQDWLCESTLKMVSMGARGLWIDVLCLLARSPIKGYLLTPLGHPAGVDWLAKQLGRPVDEIAPLWQELLDAGTPRSDAQGRVYSKRMVADKTLAEKRAEAGRLGGKAKQKPSKTKQGQAAPETEDEDEGENEVEQSKKTTPGEALVALYGEKVKVPSLDTSRHQATKNADRRIREGDTFDDLEQAVLNYAEHCLLRKSEPEFRKNAGNFFGREEIYKQFLPSAYEPPPEAQARPAGGRPKTLEEQIEYERD